MAIAMHAERNEPVIDINTKPLIDVMLVLLIMFIITISLQTHSVKGDLPVMAEPLQLPNAVKNKLMITKAGQLLWNGEAIGRVRLRQYLDITQQMRPAPELQLEPDDQAPCALVDEVMAVTKRAQVAKVGFVGNEKYVQAF